MEVLLHIENEYEMHKDLVQTSMRNFSCDKPDLIFISEEGRETKTNKRFLSLFTSLVKNFCSDLHLLHQEETVLSVPFPEETLNLLMQFLTEGYVDSQDERELYLLLELMGSLGIENNEGISINKMFPSSKHGKKIKRKQSKRGTLKKDIKSEPEEEFGAEAMTDVKEEKLLAEDSPKTEALDISDFNESQGPTNQKERKSKVKDMKEEAAEYEDGKSCEICFKQFRNNWQLKQHRITHTEEKVYECEQCGKKFKTQGILYNHRGVHNPFQCKLCDFKVAQKAGLLNHMNRIHPTEKNIM